MPTKITVLSPGERFHARVQGGYSLRAAKVPSVLIDDGVEAILVSLADMESAVSAYRKQAAVDDPVRANE